MALSRPKLDLMEADMADEPEDHNDNSDLLTDEERAALAAEEGAELGDPPDPGQTGWREEGGEGDDADAGDKGDGGEGEGETDQAAADAAAAEAARAAAEEAAKADPEPAPKEEPPQQQQQQQQQQQPAIDTGALEQQLQEIGAARNEALQSYEDGDLSSEDLHSKLAELDKQRDGAVGQLAIAQSRAEDETRRWNDAVATYMTDNAALTQDQAVLAAYDHYVGEVTANPAYAHLPFERQLEVAHRRLVNEAADLGLKDVPKPKSMQQAPAADPPPKAPAQQQQQQQPAEAQPQKTAQQQRAEEMRTPPKTLAAVPAADVPGPGDNKFSALQRLVESGADPDTVEAELAKLSPEDRDQFSSMAI